MKSAVRLIMYIVIFNEQKYIKVFIYLSICFVIFMF